MSHEEKVEQNRWRFSREITLGDLITVVTIVAFFCKIYFKFDFTLGDHEKRLVAVEDKSLPAQDAKIDAVAKQVGQDRTDIVVLEHMVNLKP